jgi:hypothetical protein
VIVGGDPLTKPWNAQSVRGFRKLGILVWICIVVLATPWSTSLHADPPPIHTASDSAAPDLDQFHAICDEVLQKEDQLTETSPLTQKLQYCKAVKSSVASSDSHGILWKVWASVSATCLGLCGWTPVGIPGAQYICTAASVGAGVAEAAITKELTVLLMTVTGAGAPLMMGAMGSATQKTAETTADGTSKVAKTNKTKRDWGACLQAAIAGVQTYMNYNSMKTDEETAKKNLASAKKAGDGSGTSIQAGSAHIEEGTSPEGHATQRSPSVGLTTQNTDLNTPDSSTSSCGNAVHNGNAGMVIQCASSAQADLPPFVKDPRFPQAFQAISGNDLGSFFKNAASPKSAILSSINDVLNPEQENQLSNALDKVAGNLPSSNSIYSGGGGGSVHSSGGEEADSTDQMLKDMMSQLLPKEPGEAEDRTPATLVFGNQPLSPEQQAHVTSANSPWSIFDRIHHRYEVVTFHLIHHSQER